MTTCRIRLGRDAPARGIFEWAVLDDKGSVLDTGASNLSAPPITGSCELVIASDLVLLERVAVPAAQRKRLSSALRFLAEDSVVPDPERIHVAVESAPAKDSLCVGIIDRQWLAQALSRLERSGFAARWAWPECLLPELAPRAWTVVWDGAGGFARTAEVEGFALDITEDGSAPVSLLLALETARASGLAPERILLRSAGQVALPDTQRWSAALGVPVERGAPWRWMEARQRPKIDLLQGEFASRGSASGWQRRLRRPAILAGALLVIGSCGIAADWEAKAHERNRLLAEMRAIYRETFGESAAVVDPPLQMSRALAELRLRAGQGGPADFLALLAPLADRLLDPARQRIDSISYENGTLAVSLQPAEQMPPGKLAEELRAKASIQGLSIRTEDVGSGGKAALRLTATAAAGR